MKIWDLPTPALIADDELVSENMACMSRMLAGRAVRLRPHYKSHKCAALAHRQMASGAVGMTCAKLSEAEDLIFSGIPDVLIANQITDPAKIARLALLARMCRLTVCVDDPANARDLSKAAAAAGSTIRCLVEYDIGMDRCGVRSPEAFLQAAKTVADLPNLIFDGIQAYAGYASHMASAAEREAATRENEQRVSLLADMLHANGMEVPVISGGSTGTAALKAGGGVYTELQAGSYLFMDSTYSELGLPFRNALFVLATVVSRHDGTVVLDAGVKAMGTDQNDPVILDRLGKQISGRYELHEEHLLLHGCRAEADLALGEKVTVIPGHCCSTVNLYDRLYLFRGDSVIDRIPVTARGRSQ